MHHYLASLNMPVIISALFGVVSVWAATWDDDDPADRTLLLFYFCAFVGAFLGASLMA